MRLRRPLLALLLLTSAMACTGDDDGAADGPTTTPDEEVAADDGYRAELVRTTDGVVHVTGDTLADAAFGQGWASSEDRPCDLVDQVLMIRGERAAHFGEDHVERDIAWRATGIFELASEDWAQVDADAREQIEAFTAGWNAQLEEVGVDGLTGWCAGESWVRPVEPVEVYAYARSLALLASSGAVLDLLAGAEPPGSGASADEGADEAALADGLAPLAERAVASNAWAVGSERSTDGRGLLLANPHFPWEGSLRFWESHLVVPGEVDAYGVQLTGLPGIGIGFTEDLAWTHTVSAGNRFTGYQLDLVEGDPTSYRFGDETRRMTSREVRIEVLGEDEPRTVTLWRSHHGPIVDVPGLGWTEDTAIAMRDANLDDDEFVEQYLGMLQADDLDELIDVHRRISGVPLFNTVAVSADGRAWYADTSATPNLSDEALAGWEAAKEANPIVGIAAQNGLVLLDGSDPVNEWVDEPGARDPGLVPFDEMPMTERRDYVFNANDSYWLSHATDWLEGGYSPLHGRQGVPQSNRTRQNAIVLDDTSPDGPAGSDGTFDLVELRDLSLDNTSRTATLVLPELVERCRATPIVDVDGQPTDLAAACDVLAGWDGRFDLDSRGAPLFREICGSVQYATGFDPDDPLGTPSGLAPARPGEPAPILVALGRAVRTLEGAGHAVDVPLGELQHAQRGEVTVPVHGGNGCEGVTNVVDPGQGPTTLEPRSGSPAQVGLPGYRVDSGTSFLLAVHLADDGPEAFAFLTYANTGDPDDPLYHEATERFAAKDWRPVAFTPEEIEEAEISRRTVTGSRG